MIITSLTGVKYTNKLIIDLYDHRWFVEEYFKIIKCDLNLKKINVKNFNSIMQIIYSQMTTVALSQYIEYIGKYYLKHNEKINKKINRSNMIKHIGTTFISNIIYEKITKNKLKNIECLIFDLINTLVIIEDNRYNDRNRTRPLTEYVKPGIGRYKHK